MNKAKINNLHDRLFKTQNGNYVYGQFPNFPLLAWFGFKIISLTGFLSSYKSGFESLSTAFLFVWAYLELSQGVNLFRKLLGLIVLGIIVFSYLS